MRRQRLDRIAHGACGGLGRLNPQVRPVKAHLLAMNLLNQTKTPDTDSHQCARQQHATPVHSSPLSSNALGRADETPDRKSYYRNAGYLPYSFLLVNGGLG
jgi:hypothetical protein